MSVPRGKVMGGSSTINGGVFVRATPDDFDGWAALGNEQWSFAKCCRSCGGSSAISTSPRSSTTEVPGRCRCRVSLPTALHPLSRAFADACTAFGFPEEPDKNVPGQPGCGRLPLNIVDGVRTNAALAYISPNRGRSNLTITSDVTARRVLFSGSRAVGVETERSGRAETFAGDEIVLCAGAVMSAQLLLLSGLGPANDFVVTASMWWPTCPGSGQAAAITRRSSSASRRRW